ncbi:hypothetical protein ACXET9_08000 [Brachybacterium sp. DNPG3]
MRSASSRSTRSARSLPAPSGPRRALSRRSLLAGGAAAAGALGLAACGGTSGGTSSSSALSWTAMLHTPTTPDASGPIMTALLEHVGDDFGFQWVPDASKEEKINASFASGAIADITTLNQLVMPSVREPLASGLFWDVEEHLADFEHLSAIDPRIIEAAKLDGKLYGVPYQQTMARYGVLVRQDWLDELGLEVPHTIDALGEVAQAFVEENPGGSVESAISDRAESFQWGFPEFAGYFGAGAFFELSEDDRIVPSFTTDAYKEAMAWYRDAYSKKWINQEFVTLQKQNQEQAIAQHKAGIVFTALFSASGYIRTAQSIDPGTEVEWALINDMTWQDVPRRIVSDTGGGMGGLMSMSTQSLKSEDDLRRALALIDALSDETSYGLMTNGIEGTHFAFDADGAVEIIDQAAWETDVQPYAASRPATYTDLFTSSDPYANLANELMAENDEYAVTNIAQSLTSPTYDASWATIEQTVMDAWNQYVVGQIDMGGYEDVLAAVAAQGMDDVIAEYTDAYAETL